MFKIPKIKVKKMFLLPVLTASLLLCQAEKVLVEKDSLYNSIKVVEDGRFLSLYCGNGHQSMMDTRIPERLVFGYTKTMMTSFAFKDKLPSDILLIGEGGGSIPKFIQNYFPGTKIDVVELDPEVNKIAQNYFDFKPADTTRVFTEDGRVYVKKAKKKYDIIMLDAFKGGYIPVHMLTREFFVELKNIMKPDGIVVSNTFTGSKIRDSENSTYFSVFKNVYEMVTSGNRIVIADNNRVVKKEHFQNRADKIDKKYNFRGFNLTNIVGSQFSKVTKNSAAQILTDDHVPAELLAE